MLTHQDFFFLHRSFMKFLDNLNKMIGDPNHQVQKSSVDAMMKVIKLAPK